MGRKEAHMKSPNQGNVNPGEPKQGTVKRIVADKGFGFIRTDNGQEHFFHRSGCLGGSEGGGFDDLEEGDTVEFVQGETSSKGFRAEQVRRIQ